MTGLVGLCFGHGKASAVHTDNIPNIPAGATGICLR
jgi:hypothetical protein